jgi:hypothetical protein
MEEKQRQRCGEGVKQKEKHLINEVGWINQSQKVSRPKNMHSE